LALRLARNRGQEAVEAAAAWRGERGDGEEQQDQGKQETAGLPHPRILSRKDPTRHQRIVVIISPDEEAKLKGKFCNPDFPDEAKLQNQARPNVLFEAGWAFGAYPEKTLLVRVGNTRPISDLGGKHIMKLTNSGASRKEFAQRLKKMKFKVDTDGTAWLDDFDFER
jgi:hypothetical protein